MSLLDDPRYQEALNALPDWERRVVEQRFVEDRTPETSQELEDLLDAIRTLMRKVGEQNPPRRKTGLWRRRGAPGTRRRRRPRVLAGALTALRLSRRKRRSTPPADLSPVRGGRRFFDPPEWPEPEGGVGVREPRRPKPPGLSGAAALALPDSDEPPSPGVTSPRDPFRLN